MRVSNASRFVLSVCTYFLSIGIVVGGGIFGAQALLQTVPMPEFLQPEHATLQPEHATIQNRRPPIEAVVELKPYRPRAVTSGVTWRTSIGRSYTAPVARTKTAGREVREKASKAKSKPRQTARKTPIEAADAYAWNPSRRAR